ncbi:MAG: PilZ domain-containing protein [Myxococcales bacterium]|nr:PilZ domain-containing protein [Myxococcales bacterium]
MNPSNDTWNRELFLVIEGLTSQLDSLLTRLRALSQAPEAGLLMGVDALYRADKDLALLCLRFDESLQPPGRRRLVRLACQGGVPVLDPERLSTSDKELFYERHLRKYAVRIDDEKSPNSAIDALGQLLGLIKLCADSESERHDPATKVGNSRLASQRELVLEPPRNAALGSESDLVGSQASLRDGPTESLSILVPEPLDLGGMEFGPAGRSASKTKQPEKLAANPKGKGRISTHMATIPARPANTTPVGSEAPAARFRRPRATSAPILSDAPPLGEQGLRVRFERGDCWMPARLRNLTLRHVRLAASAAPPLGSALRVSITLSNLEVSLPGIVVEVINTERSIDGSTSFRVEMDDLNGDEVERLTSILRRAQADGLELSPPPARKNRRFSVTWPIAIVGDGHRFSAAALDVSAQGLFLSTTNLIRARKVVFGIPLDTQESTVQGRARIARHVTEEMADEHDLSRGYGLHFESLNAIDLQRYENFLVRVGQRSQLHVLVASQSARGAALAKCFQAAGYAVTQANFPNKMGRDKAWERGRPDVAVLDERDLENGFRAEFETSFETHSIPMLHLSGQAPASARHALDRLMSV